MKDNVFSFHKFLEWVKTNPSSGIAIVDDNRLKIGENVNVRLSDQKIVEKLEKFNNNDNNLHEKSTILKKNGAIIESIQGPMAKLVIIETNYRINVPKLFLRRVNHK